MIDQLDRLIADLEHDIEVQTIRLDLARQLRATFTDEPVVEPPAAEPPPQRPKPKPAKKSKQVTCPDCGQVMGSPAGLGMHRKSKHPGSAAKPIEKVPAPKPIQPADGQKRYFACTSCDAKAETREALAKHTDSTHRRGLKGDERFARVVAA